MHEADSVKLFQVSDPVKMRPYLQCLLGLPRLCQPPEVKGLRSDQRLSYYAAIVKAGQLEGVPEDAPESTYQAIMKQIREHGQLGQLSDASSGTEAEEGQGAITIIPFGIMDAPGAQKEATRAGEQTAGEANGA